MIDLHNLRALKAAIESTEKPYITHKAILKAFPEVRKITPRPNCMPTQVYFQNQALSVDLHRWLNKILGIELDYTQNELPQIEAQINILSGVPLPRNPVLAFS